MQNLINNYFLFFHGLLAGFALLHVYLVYNRSSDIAFITYYSALDFGIRFLFQVLIAISTISSLIRFSIVCAFEVL